MQTMSYGTIIATPNYRLIVVETSYNWYRCDFVLCKCLCELLSINACNTRPAVILGCSLIISFRLAKLIQRFVINNQCIFE